MNLLATRAGRRFVFTALYFSEGAPIGFVWWTLPDRLSAAGVPVDRVTALTALVTLPWVLKFLWAPLVDALRGPRWGLKAWIVVLQAGMGLALLPLLQVDLDRSLNLVAALLLLHALFAATQDAAVDALVIGSTSAAERGFLNGWMQFGMLLGRSIFGGAIGYVMHAFGTRVVFFALPAAIWCTTALLLLCREPAAIDGACPGVAARFRAFGARLRVALRAGSTWLALAFAATGAVAFEAAGAVARPLLVAAGVERAARDWLYAGPVVVCMAAGALAGGRLSDRIGHRPAVLAVGAAIVAVVLGIAGVVGAAPHATGALQVLLAALYLLVGGFTASTYALFMDLTDPRLGATQFSAYMGATNLCEMWSGFVVGRLITWFGGAARDADPTRGYAGALAVMAVLGIAGLVLVRWLRPRTAAPADAVP